MTRRSKWWAALVALIVVAAVGTAWRRSFVAAWVAFGDPSSLHPQTRPASTPPDESSDDGASSELDRQLARDFIELGGQDLLLDEDAALAGLTAEDLPLPVTRRALRYLRFFSGDDRGRRMFEQIYRRAGRYRASIEQSLRESHMPTGLLWVAAVESGFDPQATSGAKAAGLWQLMPATARSYGLRIDPWVDERRSVELSSTVALRHLNKLQQAFGSWELALAAYNLGESGLRQAIARLRTARQTRGDPPGRVTLSDLAREQLVPSETADYVPKITAVAIAASNLERFSFARIEPDGDMRGSLILVPSETRLSTVARSAGISVELLRQLNPELLAEAIPPGAEHQVRVPAASHSRALATLPVYLDSEARDAEGLEELEMAVLSTAALNPAVGAAQLGGPFDPGTGDLMLAWLETARSAQTLTPWTARGGFGQPLSLGRAAVQPLDGLGGFPLGMWHDTFGVFRRSTQPEPSWPAPSRHNGPRDLRIEAQLGFLHAPRALEETVAHGITLRMEPDSATDRVSVGVRLQGQPGLAAVDLEGAAGVGGSELRATELVDPAELDIAVSLAVGQLGLMMAQARTEPVAALRSQLNRHRRLAVARLADGEAWLALSDMMYPPTDAAFGELLDPRGSDGTWIRDRYLLSQAAKRSASQAVISVAGRFEPNRARTLVTQALARLGLGGSGMQRGLEASSSRTAALALAVPHRKLLYAWRAPGLDERDHAACWVTLEILAGPKKSLMNRELVDRQLAAAVVARWEPAWLGSAAVVEITPAVNSQQDKLDRRLNTLSTRLADDGPTRVELAYAQATIKIRLRHRLEQSQRAIEAAAAPLTSPPLTALRMFEALRPGHTDTLQRAVDRVDARDVKRAVETYFSASARYTVEVRPTDDPEHVARR